MKKTILFICLMCLTSCAFLGDKTQRLEREFARIVDDACDLIPVSDVDKFIEGANRNLSKNRAILIDCGE